MKVLRKIVEIDEEKCNGCGLCVVDCAEGALQVIDGKARVVNEVFCDGLGACIGSCPERALRIVEREADEFDEQVVEQARPAARMGAPASPHVPLPCGCPGSAMRVFEAPAAKEAAAAPSAPARSELAQWPVQLRLVPPAGPLYAGRRLLLLADCVPVAYPDVQKGLIAGNALVLSCPKLDDPSESVAKLAQIFRNPLDRVTVAIMEVPCCSGLVRIAQEAMRQAGASVPLEVVRIGIRGDVLERVAA